MADLVTRLLLKNEDFDRNIQKSKQQVMNFDKGINLAKGGLMKMAGVIGIATGAWEGINKVLNSSQAIGDKTAGWVDSLTKSVDQLFYSMGSGDFSSFNGGLAEMISLAKDAYSALDQLGNTRISYGYFASKYGGQIAETQTLAKNKFAPTDVRQKAFEDWKKAIEAQQEANATLQADLVSYISKAVTSKAGSGALNITMADMERALAIDITNPMKRDSLKSMYGDQYNQYLKEASQARVQYTRTKTVGFGMNVRTVQEVDTEKMDKAVSQLTEQYRDAIIVNTMLNKYTDEELTAIAENARQYQELTRSVSGLIREYNETANEFNNATKSAVASFEGYKTYGGKASGSTSSGGKSASVNAPVGSINWLNQQAAALQKQFNEATDNGTRRGIQTAIDKINQQKLSIRLAVDLGDPGSSPLESSGVGKPSGKSMASDFANGAFDVKGVPAESVEANNDYIKSLMEVGNMMNSITAITNEGAAAWLSYAGNVVTAAATAIPQILAMATAKNTEATANANAMITGGMSSVASIPIVGWVMALGVAASLIGALASIPKFAKGGIVPGTSFTGDKVPAMLNSGEMVLNGTQQARLFRMINEGAMGGQQMKVTIEGDKLAVLIDRVNYKKRRVR